LTNRQVGAERLAVDRVLAASAETVA
jgi:hypothetical protein